MGWLLTTALILVTIVGLGALALLVAVLRQVSRDADEVQMVAGETIFPPPRSGRGGQPGEFGERGGVI